MSTVKKSSTTALTAAAAALILAGCSGYSGSTGSKTVASADGAMMKEAKVHCSGINSCKGTSDCATANSSCKGLNSCKGQGWVPATKADCDAKGGKVIG